MISRFAGVTGIRFNATNSAVVIIITSMVPTKRHKEKKLNTNITPLMVPMLQQYQKPVVCIIQTFDALQESPPGPSHDSFMGIFFVDTSLVTTNMPPMVKENIENKDVTNPKEIIKVRKCNTTSYKSLYKNKT